MKRFSFFALVCATTLCFSQTESPVTRSEFVQLMVRLERAIRFGFVPEMAPPKAAECRYKNVPKTIDSHLKILVGLRGFPPGNGGSFVPTQPVTRFELALALNAIYTRFEPSFMSKPVSKKLNLSKIKGRKEDGSQAAMERLAKAGILPYGSPIFEGPANTVHPKTMSAVLAQSAERIGNYLRRR